MNLKEKVLIKYDIDIDRENIFELYQLDTWDVSQETVQAQFVAARKRWNESKNDTNEKVAERSLVMLDRAGRYEAILINPMLRKEVYDYINGIEAPKQEVEEKQAPYDPAAFARDFFTLVKSTKRLTKADVRFFFEYFPEEKKRRNAIFDLLENEEKMRSLKRENKKVWERKPETEGKKKKKDGWLFCSLFQEATILNLRRCPELLETASGSGTVRYFYKEINDGLYRFLKLEEIQTQSEFLPFLAEQIRQAETLKKERGDEFAPILELLLTIRRIAEYRDVADNFSEFKLLLRYPKLSPYMYLFQDMHLATWKGFFAFASNEYGFQNEKEFDSIYFLPLFRHFGITDNRIRLLPGFLKQNREISRMQIKQNAKRERKKLPVGAEILYYAVYWPLYAAEALTNAFLFLLINLRPVSVTSFFLLLVGGGALIPVFLEHHFVAFPVVIILFLLLFSVALFCLSGLFNKWIDINGFLRSLKQSIKKIRKEAETLFVKKSGEYYKRSSARVAMNTGILAVLLCLILFLPAGIGKLGKGLFRNQTASGQGQNEPEPTMSVYDQNALTPTATPQPKQEEIKMIITESSANIRSGPGIDQKVLKVGKKDEIFIATGKKESLSNGQYWYEIFLDESKTKTGWASEFVIRTVAPEE